MKKLLIAVIILVIILPIAWYLISPIFRVVELNEESPQNLKVKDSLNNMDAATKTEFKKQVDSMRDKVIVMDDTMPSSPKIVAQGEFKPRSHDVNGKAILIVESNGKKILRFEDFNTINGPALYVYLSSGLNNDDFIDLGKLNATKGNVNYDVPPGIDISKYKYVLIWCRAFGVLFSYAELS